MEYNMFTGLSCYNTWWWFFLLNCLSAYLLPCFVFLYSCVLVLKKSVCPSYRSYTVHNEEWRSKRSEKSIRSYSECFSLIVFLVHVFWHHSKLLRTNNVNMNSFAHLWASIWPSIYNFWWRIERTATKGLQELVFVVKVGQAKICNLAKTECN